MMYTEMIVGDSTYKLRLTTRNTIALEKTLGYNPLDILFKMDRDELPKVGDLVNILHYSLQPYNHNLKLDDTYNIFDEYLGQGYSIFEFINNILVPVFKVAGLLSNKQEDEQEDEKN